MEDKAFSVTRTRKERILEQKREKTKARTKRIVGYTLAGTVATTAILNIGIERASACSDEYLSYSEITHRVVRGDTLYGLAKTYNSSVKQIQEVNKLENDFIREGQTLSIPVEKKQKDKVQEKIMSATYVVAPGDTLWSIARRFDTSVVMIKANNNMEHDFILIGQKLVINKPNIIKKTATVVGAVDNNFVEFIIDGRPTVLQVAFGTSRKFGEISGQDIEIYSLNSALVSYKYI